MDKKSPSKFRGLTLGSAKGRNKKGDGFIKFDALSPERYEFNAYTKKLPIYYLDLSGFWFSRRASLIPDDVHAVFFKRDLALTQNWVS